MFPIIKYRTVEKKIRGYFNNRTPATKQILKILEIEVEFMVT